MVHSNSNSPASSLKAQAKASLPSTPVLESTTKKWGVRAVAILAIGVLYAFANSINHHFYLLNPPNLHSAVLRTLADLEASGVHTPSNPNATAVIETLLATVKRENPRIRLNTDFQNRDEWLFNVAGGAMGSMYVVHASITEYLLIFGSAVGIEGHTGRHTADDYFHILTGQQTAYEAGALSREMYLPGDCHHLKRGVVKQYVMEPESWALEYARGWILPMFPFGFADTIFSTLDFVTGYHTLRIVGREMLYNLLQGKI